MARRPIRERPLSDDDGFTVIEALVAMAILAVSAVALIGVSEAQVSRIDGLETRAIALFVAENRLAELELSGLPRLVAPETVSMLGRDWAIALAVEETSDPDLREVSVTVVEADKSGPSAVLGGFVDARRGSP